MGKTIAFCTAATVFQRNRILDATIAKDYPGALWVTMLAQFAKERGIEVVTGDVAIARIQEGVIKPSDILVIHDESCSQGFELVSLGAKPFALVCFESPLYAGDFYEHLPSTSSLFRNRILFRGAFAHVPMGGLNHALHFPSFSLNSKEEIVAWPNRLFLVMVAGNKYWKPERSIFRHAVAKMRDIIMRRNAYISTEITEQQLHDRRLELIEYFGQRKCLDLFGTNWGDISNLPRAWRDRLRGIVNSLNPTVCSDKQAVISRYKFAICFENMSYPGYVTEKIIDCFKAGVIPIYLGAPDICDFVPKAAFVDLREYADLDELYRHLTDITEDVASVMISEGRAFLSGEAGAEYSYEGFARNVLSMVGEYE